MAKVGLMGHGTVGQGVAQVLLGNAALIEQRAGQPVELVKVLDRLDFDVPYAHLLTKESAEVTDAPDIDIVVECMGGTGAAYHFIKRALENGKHVVTSNKELVVARGTELMAIADAHNVNFFYEASVGGGIPIIHPMSQCLCANNIQRIAGILNGTTNYILTKMRDVGMGYDVALGQAQQLGYAEADPSADVLGWDARRKICILAHVAYGAALDDSGIECEGITGVSVDDMRYASSIGRVVKLLGVAERTAEGYYAYVSPVMVPLGHPLSVVDDVFNAICVRGDMVGDVMFYGRGAGTLPTASAVCADVIDAVWHMDGKKASERNACQPVPCISGEAERTRLFVRLRAGCEERAKAVFGTGKTIRLEDKPGEFAVITREDAYGRLRADVKAMADEGALIGSMRCMD